MQASRRGGQGGRMAVCPGKIQGSGAPQHGGTLLRCEACGQVGCRDQRCSNQLINANGRCIRCNTTGKYKAF